MTFRRLSSYGQVFQVSCRYVGCNIPSNLKLSCCRTQGEDSAAIKIICQSLNVSVDHIHHIAIQKKIPLADVLSLCTILAKKYIAVLPGNLPTRKITRSLMLD
jgi:hypothetical protein